MACKRCIATSKSTGSRCKRATCKFAPFCWSHSPVEVGLGSFGRGLIAKRDMKKNQVIANYKQCPVTEKRNDVNRCHLWTDGTRGAPIYDGSNVKKCIAGMANASRSGRPAKNASIRRSGQIRAIKRIKKGDEVYVTYGPSFWRHCPVSKKKSK